MLYFPDIYVDFGLQFPNVSIFWASEFIIPRSVCLYWPSESTVFFNIFLSVGPQNPQFPDRYVGVSSTYKSITSYLRIIRMLD